MRLINLDKMVWAVFIGIQVLLFYQPVEAADIAAFGDSITIGIGSESGGYPPKLSTLLDASNIGEHTVDNHGKAGEATAWGNGRIHSVLESKDYDFILILEGTNDIYFGLSLESTKYYLGAMINKSKIHYGVSPLIGNLLPDTRPYPPANQKNIETTYNPTIKNIASDSNIPLVDLYSAVENDWENLSNDQLHPNDNGYQVVAQAWYESVISLLINHDDEEEDDDEDEDENNGSGGCFIDTITVTPSRYTSDPLASPAIRPAP